MNRCFSLKCYRAIPAGGTVASEFRQFNEREGGVPICHERSASVLGRSNVTYQAASYSSIVCIVNIAAAGDGRTPAHRKNKLVLNVNDVAGEKRVVFALEHALGVDV